MPIVEPPDPIILDERLQRLCDDARVLLEYALTERRATTPDLLDPTVLLKLTVVLYPRGLESVSRKAWNDFLAAYEALSIFTYPVTAQTLRNTAGYSNETIDDNAPDRSLDCTASPATPFTTILLVVQRFKIAKTALEVLLGKTVSHRLSRLLWLSTIAFLGFIGATEMIQDIVQERDVPIFDNLYRAAQLFTAIQPFLYGGLGACTYLLRSAHRLIAARAFNGCYRPEYLNRILLGVISGGTVSMFVAVGTGESATGVALSKAALAFLAGYSTDFLFKAIERILAALFPGDATATPPASATRAAAPPTPPQPQQQR